jgi:hypothetical protein
VERFRHRIFDSRADFAQAGKSPAPPSRAIPADRISGESYPLDIGKLVGSIDGRAPLRLAWRVCAFPEVA